MLDGFINLLKPPGLTSHDMVGFVRRLLGIKRVGHTGTLDPLASGVLVMAVGRATRLIQYLEETKTYRGEITFGLTTTTLDAGGDIISCLPTQFLSQDLEKMLPKFTGTISQVPPMVSALKWRGQRLYDLARKGIEVDRKPRNVSIYKLQLLSFTLGPNRPRALIECTCSGGTYIRSLAADIGAALGSGAYLSFLLRSQNGSFNVSSSLTPDEFEKLFETSCTSSWLCPPQDALLHLSAIILDQKDTILFKHGNTIVLGENTALATQVKTVRVHNQDGAFLGIGILNPMGKENQLKPEVVFD